MINTDKIHTNSDSCNTAPVLSVDSLYASYKTIDGDVPIIQNLSFQINENEIFGIAGESGCGKSTLLNTLYGIIRFPLQIDNGTVTLHTNENGENKSYVNSDIEKTWWKSVSYIPQAAQSVLNPISRLKKQFMDSVHGKKTESNEQILSRVKNYLKELELSTDILDAFPFQLSGGMRQRAIIALATFMHPRLVLADEPTTALDVVVQRGILMMLMRLQKKYKNTMVVISHDMGVHYQITDRIAIMYSGSFVELGRTETIFNKPLHPYTQMLISSLPNIGDLHPKEGIAGRPPAFTNLPKGCRFAPRCPKATEQCKNYAPQFVEITKGHFVACHLLQKGE